MLPAGKPKPRVALVELSNDESELVFRYHRDSDWDLAAVFSTDDTLWPAKLAQSLGVPVLRSIEEVAALDCGRIVVGGTAGQLQERLAGMVDPGRTEVWSSRQVPKTSGPPGAADGARPNPPPESVDSSETRPKLAPVPPAQASPNDPGRVEAGNPGRPAPAPVPSSEADDIWNRLKTLQYDPSRGDLAGFLRSVCRTLKANSASLAILDNESEGMRLIAWHGLGADLTANPVKSLECAAGRALLGAGVQVVHTTTVPQAEDDSQPVELTHCSLPVTCRGKIMAALSFTTPRTLEVNPQDLPQDLRRAVSDAEFYLLKSAMSQSMNLRDRRQILLHGVDRAMSLDESLPERLRAAGEILTLHLPAASSHIYLTDLTGEKLQLISQPTGFGSLGTRFQSLDGGLLGWAVRSGKAHLFLPTEESPGPESERLGLYLLPLANERRTVGLIVVEGLRVTRGEESAFDSMLGEISWSVNEVISVEQGLGDQDAFGLIRIRFTEMIPALESMEPLARAQAAMDATIETLAAEAAVWISPAFPSPVLPSTMNASMLAALSSFWPEMDKLAGFIRENGRSWRLPSDPGPGPQSAVYYAGVVQPGSGGVLMAVFGDSLEIGPQLATDTITEVLHTISDHVEKDTAVKPASGEAAQPARLSLSLPEIQKRITEEWFRSLRFGHGFSISRIQIAPEHASEDSQTQLREFLRRVQRNVDLLCELEGGVFCLLSPETERFPEGLQFRLQSLWREVSADVRLVIEQKIFPRDGQAQQIFLDFAAGVG